MNVFRRFTKESLKKNKTRTLVTLIGITLSMVMFTCVVEAVYSGISFLINAEIEESGAFHGCFSDISSGDSKKLSGVDEINEASSVGLFGWASTNTGNSEKPYLLVKSADEAAEKLLGIKLLEGNMPKNKNEIILPSHLLKDSGDFSYKIGDKLVLDIGTRALPSGEELSPYDFFTEDETLSSLKKKEYTVVGFYKRLSYEAEPLSCPGYTVITSGEECSSYDLFFTLKSPKDFMEFAAEYSKNGNLSSHDNLLLFLRCHKRCKHHEYGIRARGRAYVFNRNRLGVVNLQFLFNFRFRKKEAVRHLKIRGCYKKANSLFGSLRGAPFVLNCSAARSIYRLRGTWGNLFRFKGFVRLLS